MAEQLVAASRLLDFAELVLVGLLPEGPPLYPDGELTDEPCPRCRSW